MECSQRKEAYTPDDLAYADPGLEVPAADRRVEPDLEKY